MPKTASTFPCVPARARRLAALLLAGAAAACATPRGATTRGGAKPVLLLAAEGACKTDARQGAHPDLLPDGQLCQELRAAFRAELGRVGFKVVETKEEAHDLVARIWASQATQTGAEDQRSVRYVVQVVVEGKGGEVDRLLNQNDTASAGGARQAISAAAQSLAEELASSPRLAASGGAGG